MMKKLRLKHIFSLSAALLFMLMKGGINLIAQTSECTYGDDSGATSLYYSPYGGSTNYEYYVYLYNASDFDFDGIITNISFKGAEAVDASDNVHHTIYMKDVSSETTLSTSTTFATYTDGSILVLPRTSTPAITNNSWNSISLSTSFEHSSGNSILVIVKTDGKTPTHKVYYKNVSNQIWYKQGTTDPGTNVSGNLGYALPAIKLTYTPVACSKPKALNATSITKNSATLGWTSDAESFNLQYKATDEENWETVEDINTNSYTLDGNLSSKTTYQFKVQAVCSGTPGSYSNPVPFTTSCELPYTMGFEDSEMDEFNALWQVVSSSSFTGQYKYASHTGSRCFRFSNVNAFQYLITPLLDATGGSISFYYKNTSNTNERTFKFGYSTTTNNVSAFTWDASSTVAAYNEWNEYTNTFPAGTKYIAILSNPQSSSSDLQIDDITINAPSAISRPTSLSVSNVTYNSAQFNWTAGGSETSWKLQYKKTTDADWTTVDVNSKPHTISTLDENSTYQWRVAAYIAPNMSDYESGDNFTTLAQFPAPTGLTTSSLMTSGATFIWNETAGADGYNLRYSVSSPTEWTTVSGLTEETYNIGSGLTGNTAYKVQVQAIYGENTSAWAEYSFTTLPVMRYTSTSIVESMNNWNHYMAWTPQNVPGANHDVVIEQNAKILSNNTADANDVTINAGVTLTIRSNGKLTCNNITNNGTLVIEDGGQLICRNNPTIQMQKTTAVWNGNTETGWYAIASPVGEVTISSFAQETHNVYRYDEANSEWEEYRNASNLFTSLTSGHGYLYRSTEANIVFTGSANVESGTYHLTYTDAAGNLKGFHLIGNPFTHNIYKGTNAAIESEYLEDGFYTLTTSGGWNPGTDNSTAINPAQGILVQAKSTVGEGKTLTITKTTNQGPSAAKAGNDQIMFKVENSEYSDVAYVLFKEGHGLNKINHRNAEIPMLYIIDNGENFAVADMPDNTSVINLGFEAKTIGQYTFSLKAEGQYSYMHLFDKLTGEDVDMLVEYSYSFIGAPNDRKDRFVLRLNYNAGSSTGSETEVFAYQSGNDIIVSGEGELQVFDVTGRMVMRQNINGVQTVNGLNNGVYVFRMEGKTQKIVVR